MNWTQCLFYLIVITFGPTGKFTQNLRLIIQHIHVIIYRDRRATSQNLQSSVSVNSDSKWISETQSSPILRVRRNCGNAEIRIVPDVPELFIRYIFQQNPGIPLTFWEGDTHGESFFIKGPIIWAILLCPICSLRNAALFYRSEQGWQTAHVYRVFDEHAEKIQEVIVL